VKREKKESLEKRVRGEKGAHPKRGSLVVKNTPGEGSLRKAWGKWGQLCKARLIFAIPSALSDGEGYREMLREKLSRGPKTGGVNARYIKHHRLRKIH